MSLENISNSLSSSYVETSPPFQTGDNDNNRPPDKLVLYNAPTALSIFRTAAINLFLPFVNGLMLGFGELFAHELAFQWGWGTTRVFPERRLQAPRSTAGPGIEIIENKNSE